MTDFWTADRIETLRVMTANNATASEIALALGPSCSRNMVIGKWHRLGISRPLPNAWSDDEIATLKRLHVESVPYPQIAAVICRTTAACMSKASALGLPSRGHNTFRRSRKAQDGVRKPAWGFTPKIVEGLQVPSADLAANILDVTGCKWAITSHDAGKGDHMFCNHPTEENRSYCPYHEAMKRSSPVPVAERKRVKVPTSLLRAVA